MTPEELTAAENKLFERWVSSRSADEKFIPDGVPYPERYLASDVKVLLILKEPHSADGGWDLRDYLRGNMVDTKTWDNASRWAQALQQLPSPPTWDDVAIRNQASRQAAIAAVGIMNLNKVAGGARTNPAKLKACTRANRAFLREQIALYSPDVTLLCGTADFIPEVYSKAELGDPIGNRDPFSRSSPALGCMICFSHPQQSNRTHRELYELLAVGASTAYTEYGAVRNAITTPREKSNR